MITLRKIRRNEPFEVIGKDFGISKQPACTIFKANIETISSCMKQFKVWPSKDSISKLLPIQFRTYFKDVQSIIDCFEIVIEKPSNPLHQSLTYSEFKHANTIKYLISITPNGAINFISLGYGGRISDALITEVSGYLDNLPSGCAVLADRGFKDVDVLVTKQNCAFIRPASVMEGTQSSLDDVVLSRMIASSIIHVERAIRRIREFKLLAPAACIKSKIVPYADMAVQIACGFVNMQSSLIK